MCTVYFFSFSLNRRTFEQKEALNLIECRGLDKNVFLKCQLLQITFLPCTEK